MGDWGQIWVGWGQISGDWGQISGGRQLLRYLTDKKRGFSPAYSLLGRRRAALPPNRREFPSLGAVGWDWGVLTPPRRIRDNGSVREGSKSPIWVLQPPAPRLSHCPRPFGGGGSGFGPPMSPQKIIRLLKKVGVGCGGSSPESITSRQPRSPLKNKKAVAAQAADAFSAQKKYGFDGGAAISGGGESPWQREGRPSREGSYLLLCATP